MTTGCTSSARWLLRKIRELGVVVLLGLFLLGRLFEGQGWLGGVLRCHVGLMGFV